MCAIISCVMETLNNELNVKVGHFSNTGKMSLWQNIIQGI